MCNELVAAINNFSETILLKFFFLNLMPVVPTLKCWTAVASLLNLLGRTKQPMGMASYRSHEFLKKAGSV